jgi:tetraacyldisaccharide 4'-kinase
MENFPDTAEEFRREGAVIQIGGPSELAGAIESLFADAGRRMEVGQKARALAGARGGATERAFREVERLTQWSIRRDVKTLPLFVPLWLLSRLWTLGSGQARARTRRRKLETPVVSVGGITVGGSGKTPCVIYLAQQLNAAGTRNGILTRGYRRRNAQQVTILAGGSSAPVSLTGDEAQLLLRASGSPIGIGADRHAAGKAIQERFQPSVMLLDDGFQHWKLERALDIVLIDALDPFGGSAPFPLGRLREPLEALGRADIFLLTRAGKERPLPAIEAGLRQYNQDAPVFRCHVALRGCIDGQTGQQSELPERVMAFCGLANPASFWQTLAELGCRPLAQRQFRDHHRYRRGELQDLAARAKVLGAEALVTTEKDVMNLPEGWQEAVAPLGVLSVKIGLEVEDAEGFLARIDRSLAVAAR